MISEELAEILGLLCAEGSHIISYSNYWGKDKGQPRFFKNDKSERIEFYNKDKILLNHYLNLLSKEFDYYPNITKHGKVNICKINIMRTITKHTPLGHLKWKVPDSIINSNKKVKIAFLRGYFDGDGTVSNIPRMFSTNKKGLKQVSNLLDGLNITHTWQKPMIKENRKPLYTIQISRKERESFLNIIQPISKN
jgi:intein/homing endonuclease